MLLQGILGVLAITTQVGQSALAGYPSMHYRWDPGKPIRLALTARITGSMPILQNPEPVDLDGVLRIGYVAVPRRTDPDGRTEVRFRVETAEAELLGIPISVPMEDAHKVLDRVVTFDRLGRVVHVQEAPPLPFTLSVPGVDPQRLYALLCPIVFPESPVKPGDSWEFASELLGAEGAPARFTARVLPPAAPSGTLGSELRVAEEFIMDVDQRLAEDRKPAEGDVAPALTRKGTIRGSGTMVFSPSAGKLLRGHLTIQADITETPLQPSATDGATSSVTRIKAVLQIRPGFAEKKPAVGRSRTSSPVSAPPVARRKLP